MRIWLAAPQMSYEAFRSSCRKARLLSCRSLSLTPLTHSEFAVRVDGLDTTKQPATYTLMQLREAFERHSVLVFKRVNLTDQELITFTKAFANMFPSAALETSIGPAGGRSRGKHADGTSNVSRLIGKIANFDLKTGKMLEEKNSLLRFRSGNCLWHIDSSFKTFPAIASLLLGRVVPPPHHGGETEFASSRAAHMVLPTSFQEQLEHLVCVHDFAYSFGLSHQDFTDLDKLRRRLPPARHFLVRKTAYGRSLFVGKHCSHLEGVSVDEGRALIRKLNVHVSSPRFVYRHEWSAGDLVICDNRSCIHRGRPWKNPREVKRLLCLVKIAEGQNEVARACRSEHSSSIAKGAIACPAPKMSSHEALQMLRSVGYDDLPASEGVGSMYCLPRSSAPDE
eukprot:TRINITY_DN73313_c0_g1_i1.p1 TRINITY_DN73313_c0_g1~~TRINITY_DN73313_c0_g1_i1.p1  ORF type:complete len:395 (+),score=22.49 TRINITY_DN73313_c0_g1_i1:117-1301(+)